MRKLALRTQLVLVAGLVQLYGVGVGAAFWSQSRAHARLERSFHRGLTLLANLPRLRDELATVDRSGDQYLSTGRKDLLEKRDEALARARALQAELAEVADEDDAKLLAESDRRLTAYLARRNPLISRRVSGRVTPPPRDSRALEAVFEPLSALSNVNLADLRARREEVDRASRSALLFILLAGAVAAAFVAVLLSRTLIDPVAALARDARLWALGRPWDFPAPRGAGPEVEELHSTMGEMAGRLNAQYEKEVELGRLKGTLVSMASHEFNNALSVLGSTANLLQQTEPSAPTGRRAEYYVIIEANLRGLALAVRNLLDLGLLESGRFAVRPRRADLGRVLRDAAQQLKPLHERKKLAFSVDVPPKSFARADPEALLLAVVNLLGNAVKYTPEGGTVAAGVEKDAAGLRVYVKDSGIGVKPEDRERIVAGHRTAEGKRAAHGFGLGLKLVTKVLDAHGTSLGIDGEPGKGSRFSFVVPEWDGPEEELFVGPEEAA